MRDHAVTLLGSQFEHRESLAAMLDGRVRGLNFLPDSLGFLDRGGGRLRTRLARVEDQLRGTRDRDYRDLAARAVDESGSSLVIAYWGTLPLADLMALRQVRPDVKLVLMLLCYPLALDRVGIGRQHFLIRHAARHLDGIMYPSEAMADYFHARVLRRHVPASAVIPPCWPARVQAVARPLAVSPAPNVIFTGRTDLNGRTVHQADDIRPLMRDLLEAHVELHHGYSAETDDGHPRRRHFRPLSVSELIARMGGHDASLVAYNTQACARDDRFRLTVPDRLITSVAAGVPIAIPSRGYAGAKGYLAEYPALIEFDSPADLAGQLADRPRVAGLRDAAWTARASYTAESQGARLQDFLEGLL